MSDSHTPNASSTADLDRAWTKSDWARVLGKSERSIDRLYRSNQLPPQLPISGRPRWSSAVAMAWLSTGRRRR